MHRLKLQVMNHHFKKHYTLQEARDLLPQIEHWLKEMIKTRDAIAAYDAWAEKRLALGDDLGGSRTVEWLELMDRFQETSRKLEKKEIQVKNLDRGLIDFPSIRNGLEVFLCWEMGEEDIGFWHDIASGYAGRKAI